jgi:hypothetical protein
MDIQQFYTVAYFAALNRVPPAVVERLISTAGIAPRIVLNEQRQYAADDLGPVTDGALAYLRGDDEVQPQNPHSLAEANRG